MRILIATTEFPPIRFGGSGASVSALVEALRDRGHWVTVVTPNWAEAPDRETSPSGEVVRFLVPSRRRDGRLPSERTFVGVGWLWRAARALYPLALAHDVVHTQDRRIALAGFLAARLAGRPAVLTLRDVGLCCPIVTCLLWEGRTIPADCGQRRLWWRCTPWFHRAYHGGPWAPGLFRQRLRLAVRFAWLALERRLLRRYDRVACVSRGLAQHYESVFPQIGILPSPAPPPPPPDHTCEKTDPPIVLFVGKPSLGKGWEDFTDAALCLRRGRPDLPVRFVHVGPAPVYPAMNIEAAGPVSPDAMASWYCRSTLVVLPSRNADALPRVGLEALAHGTPVIGTRSGGIEDLLAETRGGLLVEPRDPLGLAGAIGKLLSPESDSARRGLGVSARHQTALRFGAETVARAHERLYNACVRDPPLRHRHRRGDSAAVAGVDAGPRATVRRGVGVPKPADQ